MLGSKCILLLACMCKRKSYNYSYYKYYYKALKIFPGLGELNKKSFTTNSMSWSPESRRFA